MRQTETELAQVLRTGPFHLALRTALSVRGLPLQRVQHHLAHRGVKLGVTSLSYWQQGVRRPRRAESLRAVAALEEVLALPDDSLLRLLRDGDAPADGDRPAGRSYRSLMEASGSVERLLAAMESPVDGGLHTVGHQERVRIGARRELAGRTSQHVVRAHRDGVDRYLAVLHGVTPAATRRGSRCGLWRTAGRAGSAGTGTRGCWWRSCSSTPGCGPVRRTSSATASRTVRAGPAASTYAASPSGAGSTCSRSASTRRRSRCGAAGSPRPRRGRRAGPARTSR